MSKIIKSQQCVEAHPCRLDPVDVDAFFVNNPEVDETQNSSSETDAETAATLEEILETIFPPGENPEEEAAEESVEAEPEKPEEQETKSNELVTDAPGIDLFKINLEAEELIGQSKQEAGILTQLAREKAEGITGTAKEEATGIIGQAITEAAGIKEKAELHADGIVEKAQQQAGEALNQAKREAENIIDQARRQAEELKAEALQQGSEAGYQEGLAKAKQEMETNLANSIKLMMEAEEERTLRIASSETELLKLVTGIAEKIIGSELKSHPEQIVSIVREALTKAATANSITVKINPDDQQLIQENLPSLQEVFSDPKTIGINPDQTVLPGNCFIETEHGKVDARVRSQLERIMNEILKAGQVNEPD